MCFFSRRGGVGSPTLKRAPPEGLGQYSWELFSGAPPQRAVQRGVTGSVVRATSTPSRKWLLPLGRFLAMP